MDCTVFGGAGEIGGNQVRFRSDGDETWLDFGLSYARYGRFFEEYLRPRAAPVLADLLRTGVAPRVDMYREDLKALAAQRLGDLGLDRRPERVRLFLSHPHMDHCGLFGLLRPDIDVSLSVEAVAVMYALQKTAMGFPNADLLWVSPREEDGKASRSAVARRLTVAGEPSSLTRFMGEVAEHQRAESPKSKPAPELALTPSGGIFYPVDHSIPGATVWALPVEGDTVVYPGDFRLHGCRGEVTVQAAERLRAGTRGRSVLVLEGTRYEPGKPTSRGQAESDVLEQFRRAVAGAEGRLVVIDFAARNVERLMAAWAAALNAGRELVVLPKDAFLLLALQAAHSSNPTLPFPVPPEQVCKSVRVYGKSSLRDAVWQRFIAEKYEALDYMDIRERPGRYVLCMSFFDITEMVDIVGAGTANGVYVYSSSEPYSEEQRMDVERLGNWLKLLGLRFIGADAGHTSPFHVSGHACPDDAARFAQALRPDTIVVVHTEHPQEYALFLRERLPGARVLVPEHGRALAL